MKYEKAIKKILEYIKMDEEDLELLERLVALEEDKERVLGVDLGVPFGVNFDKVAEGEEDFPRLKVYVRINQEKWFKNNEDLFAFLEKHSITNYGLDECSIDDPHQNRVVYLSILSPQVTSPQNYREGYYVTIYSQKSS